MKIPEPRSRRSDRNGGEKQKEEASGFSSTDFCPDRKGIRIKRTFEGVHDGGVKSRRRQPCGGCVKGREKVARRQRHPDPEKGGESEAGDFAADNRDGAARRHQSKKWESSKNKGSV